MAEAYVVDAIRTAVGKRGGGFAEQRPADMAAHVIKTVARIQCGRALPVDAAKGKWYVGEDRKEVIGRDLLIF